MPVIAEHTMKYKKALKLFQKYKVQMEVTGSNEKAFHMAHTFLWVIGTMESLNTLY
jgi:acyl-CoA thioesterase FadM